jgi:hypothetical protein
MCPTSALLLPRCQPSDVQSGCVCVRRAAPCGACLWPLRLPSCPGPPFALPSRALWSQCCHLPPLAPRCWVRTIVRRAACDRGASAFIVMRSVVCACGRSVVRRPSSAPRMCSRAMVGKGQQRRAALLLLGRRRPCDVCDVRSGACVVVVLRRAVRACSPSVVRRPPPAPASARPHARGHDGPGSLSRRAPVAGAPPAVHRVRRCNLGVCAFVVVRCTCL